MTWACDAETLVNLLHLLSSHCFFFLLLCIQLCCSRESTPSYFTDFCVITMALRQDGLPLVDPAITEAWLRSFAARAKRHYAKQTWEVTDLHLVHWHLQSEVHGSVAFTHLHRSHFFLQVHFTSSWHVFETTGAVVQRGDQQLPALIQPNDSGVIGRPLL